MPKLISRLFPFKRGLCHAYWAPNIWAIYNIVDKILSALLMNKTNSTNSSTSGLVQDINHVVLPNITPFITFILSFIAMILPICCLIFSKKSNLKRKQSDILLVFIIICAFGSYLFGWHVHEKAILLITIPFK
jgi:alpha-1,3-glucosyltransferase